MRTRRALILPGDEIKNLQSATTIAITEDPQERLMDLNDSKVRKWDDAVAIFGDPGRTAHHDDGGLTSIDPTDRTFTSRISRQDGRKTGGVKKLVSTEAMMQYKRHDFNAREFVEKHMGDEAIGQYKVAIDRLVTDREQSSVTFRQTIAENIHNYVKAQDDLLDTRRQFEQKQFPGQEDVHKLHNRIVRILDDMRDFFKDISSQAKEAQNASVLLAGISRYSGVFRMSSDIDNYRDTGRFDKIADIVKQSRKYAGLESVPLFSQALEAGNTSLRNVKNSLRDKIAQMSPASFSENMVRLLLDIQHEGNPMYQLLESLDSRIRECFDYNYLSYECDVISESFILWRKMCKFFARYDETAYQTSLADMNTLLETLVGDVYTHTLTVLEGLRDAVPAGESFNSDLHENFRLVFDMWSKESASDILTERISGFRKFLQNWYITYLRSGFSVILESDAAGVRLTDFLLHLLDKADLFDSSVYHSLIVDPIFGMFDGIHERAFITGSDDLVSSLTTLSALDNSLDRIISQYNKVVDGHKIDEEDCDLKIVARELNTMLINKLLGRVVTDINKAIYQGIYNSSIDWGKDVPIQIDGYTVYVMSKCIECKNSWHDVYDLLRGRLVDHIVSSILNTVDQLRELSNTGRYRLKLNIEILKDAFYDGVTAVGLWDALSPILGEESPQFGIGAVGSGQTSKLYEAEYSRARRNLALQIRALRVKTV